MFSNIRIFAYSAAGIFLLMIVLSVLGSILEKAISPLAVSVSKLYAQAASAIFGTLFFLLGFMIIPVALRTFVKMQTWISNEDLPMVRFIQQNECTITYILWGIMIVFIVVMLPQIIKDMSAQ